MFHARLNNFPVFRNYRDIDLALLCIGRSGNKCSNLNELKFDVKFCNIKEERFKRHFSTYWPNVGVGDMEKAVLTNQIRARSANRAAETLLIMHQGFFVSI